MAWLTRDDEVLAALEVAGRGWRQAPLEGARLVAGPRLVHTLGVAENFDVAWCRPQHASTLQLEVRRVRVLRSWRLARPCGPRLMIVVAPAGAFERWRLRVGDVLEVAGE